jgi:hypothetical protein
MSRAASKHRSAGARIHVLTVIIAIPIGSPQVSAGA